MFATIAMQQDDGTGIVVTFNLIDQIDTIDVNIPDFIEIFGAESWHQTEDDAHEKEHERVLGFGRLLHGSFSYEL